MISRGYDALADEYYDPAHKTCRNFDAATQGATAAVRAQFPDAGLVLEVGCGRGRAAEFLHITADRVVQLDSSQRMLCLAEREASLLRIHADATAVPLAGQQFSAVVGFLIDPFIGLGFFAEAFRILVPGGYLLFTTPAWEWGSSLRGNSDPDASSARFVTKRRETVLVPSMILPVNKIEEMLAYCGFEAVGISQHNLPRDAGPISPDIEQAAQRKGVGVYELPILYLALAVRPR